MIPGPSQHLGAIAATLGTRIIPALPEGHYAAGDAGMLALVAALMAQHVEVAADVLASQNNGMRALFARAGTLIGGELGVRLSEAAQARDRSLRLSALEAENAALSRLLIETQVALEDRVDTPAAELERDIWHLLKAGAEARMVMLPNAAG